jgi:hypothetical protein
MTQIIDLSRKNIWFSRDFYANFLTMKQSVKISRDELEICAALSDINKLFASLKRNNEDRC